MDHQPTGNHFSWRRIVVLICAVLFLFILVQASMFCIELKNWNQDMAAQESCITANQMNSQLQKYPPFDLFPAQNAEHITLFHRSLGLVGYETWVKFDFVKEQDFNAYMKSVTTHPEVTEDEKIAWDTEMRLPSMLVKQMRNDMATSGVRATWRGGNHKQWLFFPEHHRVLSICTD